MSRPQFPLYSAVIATVALLATSCSHASRPARSSAPPAATISAAEFETLYNARQAEAKSRFTEADVNFMTGMIAHHAQALVMAGMAPTHGASRSVQTLAARIINAQRDEIATMQQWLRERGQPVPEVHIMGTEVHIMGPGGMGHGAGHHHDMPGMLTPEQMKELDTARGPEFDRLFLTYMIQHHRGAVLMVRDLFATDGAARDEEVFKIASDIHVDQITEIARMESMLAALGGAGTHSHRH